MQKKQIVVLLRFAGILFLCASLILAMIATGSKSIIGGADLPTFLFVFFYEKRGLYSALAFLGAAAMAVSLILKKNGGKHD